MFESCLGHNGHGYRYRPCRLPELAKGIFASTAGVSMTLLDGTINMDEKLPPRAVNAAGRSHMFGNLMKHACHNKGDPLSSNACARYAECFGTSLWHRTIIATLKVKYPALEKDTCIFPRGSSQRGATSRFWLRFGELLRVRELCQTHLANPQAVRDVNIQQAKLLGDLGRLADSKHCEFASLRLSPCAESA